MDKKKKKEKEGRLSLFVFRWFGRLVRFVLASPLNALMIGYVLGVYLGPHGLIIALFEVQKIWGKDCGSPLQVFHCGISILNAVSALTLVLSSASADDAGQRKREEDDEVVVVDRLEEQGLLEGSSSSASFAKKREMLPITRSAPPSSGSGGSLPVPAPASAGGGGGLDAERKRGYSLRLALVPVLTLVYLLWLVTGTVWVFKGSHPPASQRARGGRASGSGSAEDDEPIFQMTITEDCRIYSRYLKGLVIYYWLATAVWIGWMGYMAMRATMKATTTTAGAAAHPRRRVVVVGKGHRGEEGEEELSIWEAEDDVMPNSPMPTVKRTMPLLKGPLLISGGRHLDMDMDEDEDEDGD